MNRVGLKKIGYLIVVLGMLVGLVSISADNKEIFDLDQSDDVHEVLAKLGQKELNNLPSTALEGVSLEAGKRMVLEGFSMDANGRRLSKLSNHFVCTSCHNIVKEQDDLSIVDPQVRLEYARDNNLPFVQGSPLYGLVNRATFYNGDYVKKYGDLANKAHKNIREAIQLCAIECAQGRRLQPWELESILIYLWDLQLKIKDLNLTQEEEEIVEAAVNDGIAKEAAISLIKSKYLPSSPATFGRPPDDMLKGYAEYEGDAENGRLIYELGCQHCHEKQRYSFFELDDSELSFKYLQKHIRRHRRFSFYWVSRYGTKPKPGKKAYMPQYTEERMSDNQLEDLRAYIDQRAN